MDTWAWFRASKVSRCDVWRLAWMMTTVRQGRIDIRIKGPGEWIMLREPGITVCEPLTAHREPLILSDDHRSSLHGQGLDDVF